jgi:hypothetical protein
MEGFEQMSSLPEAEPLRTIEEHATSQGVAPSIFAAVMQSQCWATGKKTTETVFKDAVNAFLGAPIGR